MTALDQRTAVLDALGDRHFDLLVIGGGATGLGVAVDAASRGLSTALVEAHDLAQGTSSRSTKLVHGGVRYLEQLDLGLVREALHERGLMAQNAPHLVHDLRFVVPRYAWWEAPFYGAGLKLYDALAGSLSLGPSRILTREETIAAIPNVQRDGLLGGVAYHDGQFDDARMAVTLARTAAAHGALIATRCRVASLWRGPDSRVAGVVVHDEPGGRTLHVRARAVVNATGIFADSVRRMEDPSVAPVIEPAQGVHLVLPRDFQPGESAIMVPHTDDGRVLFVIPWHGRVIVGTTDTPMREPAIEPRALDEEIEFILRNAARYLERDPGRSDVLSVFAGQRPLVHAAHAGSEAQSTKSISRHHEIFVGSGGMVTIVGGKWTTYRRMAEETVDRAVREHGLTAPPSSTRALQLHGWLAREEVERRRQREPGEEWALAYGAEQAAVQACLAERPEWGRLMEPRLPYPLGLAVWAVRHEWALRVEDVLARRTRALLLDARASMECAERVAEVMASELGRSRAWVADEVNAFVELARGYLAASDRSRGAPRSASGAAE
ncbi:MAG: glycerol-3-phosphate dehydrogenase/oxidase [Phycisphaeraceae bacterium]|nr:glycerol-3-phosphate dehydrogenase/oxidase [Phycisphaeraceae bacterium]